MARSSLRTGSPGDGLFPLMVARWLGLDNGSIIADVGCGSAMSGVRLAHETGCRLVACDVNASALDAVRSTSHELGLAGKVEVQPRAFRDFVAHAAAAGLKYDLILSEGGLFSYLSFADTLAQAALIMAEDGHILFSTLVLRGISASHPKHHDVAAPTPPDVVQFYTNTPMSDGGRELLTDNALNDVFRHCGFSRTASWSLPASYWSDFYSAIHEAGDHSLANWRGQDDHLNVASIYETFYNAKGRFHIDYCYYLLTLGRGS